MSKKTQYNAMIAPNICLTYKSGIHILKNDGIDSIYKCYLDYENSLVKESKKGDIICNLTDNIKTKDIHIVSSDKLSEGKWVTNGTVTTIFGYDFRAVYSIDEINEFKIIVATSNDDMILHNSGCYLYKIDDEFIERYTEDYINITEVEIKPEISDGWMPTPNDPDNSSLAPMAEPTGIMIIKEKYNED